LKEEREHGLPGCLDVSLVICHHERGRRVVLRRHGLPFKLKLGLPALQKRKQPEIISVREEDDQISEWRKGIMTKGSGLEKKTDDRTS